MTTSHQATPNDSRYVPFTQQGWCCVPTSVQMIMYRHDIPLVSAEEIGYHLGLTVPPDQSHLFFNARTSDSPPTDAGYGTQIQTSGFGLNDAFAKLNIPLTFDFAPISSIETSEQLLDLLNGIEKQGSDALLCFNHGFLKGKYEPFTGHVVVFDRIIDGKVRIVDASPNQPKWRLVEFDVIHEAMRLHGDDNSGGVWHIRNK